MVPMVLVRGAARAPPPIVLRETRWQPMMKAAVGSGTFLSCETGEMASKTFTMMRSVQASISSSAQQGLEQSCSHSKRETVTSPASAGTSGMIGMPPSVGSRPRSWSARLCAFGGNQTSEGDGLHEVTGPGPELLDVDRLSAGKAGKAAMSHAVGKRAGT